MVEYKLDGWMVLDVVGQNNCWIVGWMVGYKLNDWMVVDVVDTSGMIGMIVG